MEEYRHDKCACLKANCGEQTPSSSNQPACHVT